MNFYELDLNSLKSGEGWVMVFPRGEHYIDKYETTLNFNDKFFSSIEKWWKGSTFKKPYLDKGHAFDEKYGEFTEYRITDKGMEMYLILNDEGKALVKSDKYSYLSPFFGNMKDSSGKKFENVVLAVSLVNSPALMVLDKIKDQIALSIKGNENKIKGGSQVEIRELLASKLKLSFAADDMSILTRIDELLNAGATIDDLKAEIQTMKDELKSANDKLAESELACKTARDEKKKMSDELSIIKTKQLNDEAVSVIDEAIKLGQYHPSLKEMKVESYIKDKDSVMKELAVIPKVEKKGQITSSNVESFSCSITEEDKKIFEDAGYDLSKPEDVALAMKCLSLNKEGK